MFQFKVFVLKGKQILSTLTYFSEPTAFFNKLFRHIFTFRFTSQGNKTEEDCKDLNIKVFEKRKSYM